MTTYPGAQGLFPTVVRSENRGVERQCLLWAPLLLYCGTCFA